MSSNHSHLKGDKMNWWLSLRGTVITRSIKFLLLILCILISVMAWMGKSALEASEVRFSNDAQVQHAENVAISAALQDPRVREAIEKAKETRDPEDIRRARALLARTVRAIISNIARMRQSGMGWGKIAHHYEVHPSVLGLGHSKTRTQYGLQTSKQARTQSKIHGGTPKSSKGDRGRGHGGGRGGGRGGGHGGGKK